MQVLSWMPNEIIFRLECFDKLIWFLKSRSEWTWRPDTFITARHWRLLLTNVVNNNAASWLLFTIAAFVMKLVSDHCGLVLSVYVGTTSAKPGKISGRRLITNVCCWRRKTERTIHQWMDCSTLSDRFTWRTTIWRWPDESQSFYWSPALLASADVSGDLPFIFGDA